MAQGDVFSLVQQFDKLRQSLGSGGGGVGRPRPVAEAYPWTQRTQQYMAGFQPQAATAAPAAGGLNLVEWNGHRFDRSILGQLQHLAATFPGLRVTSGYRDPARNAQVNGVKNSRHLTGRAVDLVGDAKTMQAAAAWAKQNGIPEVLIHNAGSGTHLHLGWGF